MDWKGRVGMRANGWGCGRWWVGREGGLERERERQGKHWLVRKGRNRKWAEERE